jgi:L-2-hydroxyglutarate oxidase
MESFYKDTRRCQGDLFEILTFAGFVKIAAKYWHTGMEVWRSLSKAFVKALHACSDNAANHCLSIRSAQAITQDGMILNDLRYRKF